MYVLGTPRTLSFPYRAAKDDAVKWPISAIRPRDCTSLIAPSSTGREPPPWGLHTLVCSVLRVITVYFHVLNINDGELAAGRRDLGVGRPGAKLCL